MKPSLNRHGRRWLIATAALAALAALRWHFPSASRLTLKPAHAEAFASADTWELLTLDPAPDLDHVKSGDPMPTELFYWKAVLGRRTLHHGAARRTLTRAFNRGTQGFNHWAAMCFNPRHAIRVQTPDGKALDLLICFQCQRYRVREPGRPTLESGTIRQFPAATFNRVCRDLGLRLPPSPDG